MCHLFVVLCEVCQLCCISGVADFVCQNDCLGYNAQGLITDPYNTCIAAIFYHTY